MDDLSDRTSGHAHAGDSPDPLRDLHRGEAAAAETYRMALEADTSAAGSLALLLHEHDQAAEDLRRRLKAPTHEPKGAAGTWGELARAFLASSHRCGSPASLKALRLGEEDGIRLYESALSDARIDSKTKDVIRSKFLPRQRQHVILLDSLLRNW